MVFTKGKFPYLSCFSFNLILTTQLYTLFNEYLSFLQIIVMYKKYWN